MIIDLLWLCSSGVSKTVEGAEGHVPQKKKARWKKERVSRGKVAVLCGPVFPRPLHHAPAACPAAPTSGMYFTEVGLWLLCLFVGLQRKLKMNVYRLCHQQKVWFRFQTGARTGKRGRGVDASGREGDDQGPPHSEPAEATCPPATSTCMDRGGEVFVKPGSFPT